MSNKRQRKDEDDEKESESDDEGSEEDDQNESVILAKGVVEFINKILNILISQLHERDPSLMEAISAEALQNYLKLSRSNRSLVILSHICDDVFFGHWEEIFMKEDDIENCKWILQHQAIEVQDKASLPEWKQKLLEEA